MKKRKRASGVGKPGLTVRQYGALLGVLILVAAILALKHSASSDSPDLPKSVATGSPALNSEEEPEPAESTPLAPAADELPQAHLERMLAEGVPVLAFFHSNSCAQCIEMTGIVEAVYPEFASRVALVDVNVYDTRNQTLLQQAGVRVIPTLLFIDHSGVGQGFTGVMPADQLKAELTSISSGDAP